MAYVSTYLKKELVIESIITIHYFEYPSDFVFRGCCFSRRMRNSCCNFATKV